ncbi:NAD-dependent epimerase/dehydratase family protein [Rhizobium sp. 32-5/1]|uniref:NAD-dependent epimerase/dehydratase family protein n=1 Tax=Rhizobium sp. 32-5/1 TaxID=3019602 RepID=UPI00240D64B7|nr:NAD-dependent epimerase/dehydratase family protein [Rhizobium sp. 32-5/1]WEZ84530.1 NAD-dependent epimerase/dehydratase family protein [Rhizobium sp. 32-5/1]
MSRVLLTGATGFVGRQIHRHLLALGHQVVAVVRPGSQERLIGPAAGLVVSADGFKEDAQWWEEACAGIDAVIHAAWYVEPGKYLDSPQNMACVTGTVELAKGATAAGVHHFIGVGTCMEYRLPSEHLDIGAPTDPTTLYAACKLSVYHMLREWFSKQGALSLGAESSTFSEKASTPRDLCPTFADGLRRAMWPNCPQERNCAIFSM